VKFLLVNHEYPPVGGGAATATYAIAHNLSALGHDVAVLAGSYRELPRHNIEKGVAVHRVRCVRKRADQSNLFEMATFMSGVLFALPSVLAKYRPDGLIIFFSLPSGPVGVFSKLFLGLPYLVSLRGGDVPGLVPELKRVHKMVAPIRRFVLKHARAIVANAEGLRKLSEAADPFPVQVIPNGVNTGFFCPGPIEYRSHRSGPLRIIFVGRLQKQKNVAFLLKQLPRLPIGSFELHVVGDGPLKQNLRSLAEKLDIAAAVTWHGWLPREGLRNVYQSADCLVNPSLYEGMPNAVLEAMACCVPVIASDVPGNNELVIHGKTGFLFELDHAEKMTSALTQLRDVDLRLCMGESARARALDFFSWKTVASKYADLLAGCSS
jgi:glycosyltransferase involved in cell wall biosynthesis